MGTHLMMTVNLTQMTFPTTQDFRGAFNVKTLSGGFLLLPGMDITLLAREDLGISYPARSRLRLRKTARVR